FFNIFFKTSNLKQISGFTFFASLILGLGITSLIFYISLNINFLNNSFPYIFDVFLLLIILLIKQQNIIEPVTIPDSIIIGKRNYYARFILTFILFVSAITIFTLTSISNPHGVSDTFFQWNLRAKFMFLPKEEWKQIFLIPQDYLVKSYPLLLPGTIARIWKYMNNDAIFVYQIVSIFFSFSLAGMLFYSFKTLNSLFKGYISIILLMGTPMFLQMIPGQFADMPISLFIFSSLFFCIYLIYIPKITNIQF
ncbi:MAG: hypothetical protein ACD_79C01142G0003, partial [uncultured bacterium]